MPLEAWVSAVLGFICLGFAAHHVRKARKKRR